MTAALSDLLRDARLRAELASAGRQRAASFSWERTARETAESYERAWAEAVRTSE